MVANISSYQHNSIWVSFDELVLTDSLALSNMIASCVILVMTIFVMSEEDGLKLPQQEGTSKLSIFGNKTELLFKTKNVML